MDNLEIFRFMDSIEDKSEIEIKEHTERVIEDILRKIKILFPTYEEHVEQRKKEIGERYCPYCR